VLRAAGVRTPIVVVAHDVTAVSVPAFRQLTAGAGWRQAGAQLVERMRVRTEAADLDAVDLVLVFKEEDGEALRALGSTRRTT
jgi:hypothetical protein